MTRKDYQGVARVLSDAREDTTDSADPAVRDALVDKIAEKLADDFALDNPRFDRQRFIAATREDQKVLR